MGGPGTLKCRGRPTSGDRARLAAGGTTTRDGWKRPAAAPSVRNARWRSNIALGHARAPSHLLMEANLVSRLPAGVIHEPHRRCPAVRESLGAFCLRAYVEDGFIAAEGVKISKCGPSGMRPAKTWILNGSRSNAADADHGAGGRHRRKVGHLK